MAMAAFDSFVPTMVGGAADLTASTNTIFPGGDDERLTRDHVGRNVFFGVREHGMGGVVNGMAAHGGIVRPYGSTFLQFADYMRGSIRLSALMQLKVTWVFTHDSVALGEDGPTHQPVEHLAALRAIPGLTVIRPGDPLETAEAWRVILEELSGPAVLILSRQNLPVMEGAAVGGLGRGAYVVRATEEPPQAVIVGTGSEVHTALEAADLLAADGLRVQVVSMPSWELLEAQDDAYRQSVLPLGVPKVSVEAGISMGWATWVDASVSIERFGASAPGDEVLERLGISAAATAAKVRELIG
jgi:transketolase